MGTTVQARFDGKAEAALKRLIRRNGWTTSEALRECVLQADEQSSAATRPRMIGIGCVAFGPGDMATDKKYMEGFGLKSMGKNWRPPRRRAR